MAQQTNGGKRVAGFRVDGTKIRTLRNLAVMSRQELTSRARVSYSTLANLETGFKANATPETIRKIAYGLGVSPKELLELEEEEGAA